MRTEGIIDLKLLTDTHETVHTFHVLGEPFELHYDGILGKEFLEEIECVINYCSRQIIMNDEIVVNFDLKPCINKTESCRLTLRVRTENIVRVPANYKGLVLLDKNEILPGVYLASALTRGENGVCVTSIINSTERHQTVNLLSVDLKSLEEGEGSLNLTLSAVANSDGRLTDLRNQLRLDHLNSEERASIVTICEDYNDIFHLPNVKLPCTSTIEHAIPTPNVDPYRAINVKPYRIPKVHRDEVQRQTEQMLSDGVIQHSFSI